MSPTQPGADELRVRAILKTRGVGPAAAPPPPAIPPQPPTRPRDWLDDILDSPASPERPAPQPQPTMPPPPPATVPAAKQDQAQPPKPKKQRAAGARSAWDTQAPQDPRQSLAEAWDRVPPRLRWLALHATAAAAGWRFGIVDWGTDTAAWYAAGHWTAPSAWVLYVLGGGLLALYRRSRGWAWPVAWAATIPVSSIAVGMLLYGTGYQ
jgi:hypothetical protein